MFSTLAASRKIIIYDGPDRVGKTEQAKELSRILGIPYFKNNDEHKYFLTDPSYFLNAIRYVDTYFTSFLESTLTQVVLDRSWPSEWIYSQAFNRNTDLSVLRELDLRHAQLGTVIVIPQRTSYEGKLDQYDSINEKINEINDLYTEFKKWTTCDVISINVDDENLQREMIETCNALENIYNKRKK